MAEYWGYHSIFDCAGCDITKISNRENILAFTKELISAIKMVQYGETICEHFATHDPGKSGYTMLAMIETSNLGAHFVESTGEAYIDVFSCVDFDYEVARGVVQKYFDPASVSHRRILRKAI